MSEYVSYADAAFVAIKMVEGLNPRAFYDEIPSKKGASYMLNWNGMSLLGGIMGVKIVKLEETDESDETQVVMRGTAVNQQGDEGYSWLSRPKQGYDNKEDDWREKILTHAKRNCMRDLVPYQLFLELLLAKNAGKQVATENPVKAEAKAKADPLEQAKSHAREIAKAKRNELVASGITEEGADAAIKHIILSTEEHFEDVQADWKPSQWIEFGKTLKRLEVDPDETPEQQAKDEVEEAEPTTEAEPTPEPEVEELPEVEASEESEDSDNANQLELLLDEVDDITKKK